VTEPIGRRRAAAHRLLAGLGGVILTSIVGSLGVFATYYPLRNASAEAQWLLVFLQMLGESAAIHLPSEVILPVAGWLVVKEHGLGIPGLLGISAVAALGNTAGSGLLYAAGRLGGRRLVRRFGRYFLVEESDVDAIEERMRKHRAWGVFIARLLPVVRTYVGFVAGLLRVPVGQFLALTFIGSFIWALAFAALGYGLGSNWEALKGPGEIAGIAVIALLLLALIASTLRLLKAEPHDA
jgi:membrane protein DedA with SNARE-associated domain